MSDLLLHLSILTFVFDLSCIRHPAPYLTTGLSYNSHYTRAIVLCITGTQ